MYDGILVNINKFPKLKNKSVLYVNKIEDLVDAQAEMRKPIYYVKRESATAFYLLNDDIFLIYFLKIDKNELSGLEAEIKKLELEGSIKFENFKDIDKTFILQTEEKTYKVSPVREKKEEEVKEETKPEEIIEGPKEEIEKVPEEETEEEEEFVVKNPYEFKENDNNWDTYFKFGNPEGLTANNTKEEIKPDDSVKLVNPIEEYERTRDLKEEIKEAKEIAREEKEVEPVFKNENTVTNDNQNTEVPKKKKKKKKKKKNNNNNVNQ